MSEPVFTVDDVASIAELLGDTGLIRGFGAAGALRELRTLVRQEVERRAQAEAERDALVRVVARLDAELEERHGR